MKKWLIYSLCLVFFLIGVKVAVATELIYTPVNPAFGGSPLNGQYLLNQATAQDKFKDKSLAFPQQTFKERLENMLLSAMAAKIAGDIFGEEGLTPGTYTIGSYVINVTTNGQKIAINIVGPDGQTTIEIPYF
ncbi:MAG: curli production assembly/transport component CsgF [Bacteroidia bacterium]|nr:curli production assembly/transport component CsgF [Bacteroidia bacterium]